MQAPDPSLAGRLTRLLTTAPNLTKTPWIGRWLIRRDLDGGSLRHEYETARAVRRRLGLSARQYKKRVKAHTRSGYIPPELRRRRVAA